jgi:broad specificity phosphatase PhoE
MSSVIVFETHSISEDNERGLATGWLPGRLSAQGREAARKLGGRRRDDGLSAVFTSDLGRAVETAELAFGSTGLPILHDWRLRECDYGDLNSARREDVPAERRALVRYGVSRWRDWRQAVHRAAGLLLDVPTRWDDKKVIIIGHVAIKWALDHTLRGVELEVLISEEFV